jgi:hypothetical protein
MFQRNNILSAPRTTANLPLFFSSPHSREAPPPPSLFPSLATFEQKLPDFYKHNPETSTRTPLTFILFLKKQNTKNFT